MDFYRSIRIGCDLSPVKPLTWVIVNSREPARGGTSSPSQLCLLRRPLPDGENPPERGPHPLCLQHHSLPGACCCCTAVAASHPTSQASLPFYLEAPESTYCAKPRSWPLRRRYHLHARSRGRRAERSFRGDAVPSAEQERGPQAVSYPLLSSSSQALKGAEQHI